MFSRFSSPSSTSVGQSKSSPAPGSHTPTLAGVTNENKFSLPYLRKLYQTLVENKVVTENNEGLVIEILYTIAEISVYGDNKSELLFDFFCEKNMLSLFLEIMWANEHAQSCPVRVHIQILQTLSIMINSVKNNTSLYYLLSNNYINEIIVYPHNFEEDESLRDQFISFMKTLSLRLNIQTVQFFFVEETGAFPLISRAIEFLHFNEPMVRIASQTCILNVLQVCDMRAREYALQDDLIFKFLCEVVKIFKSHYNSMLRGCKDFAALYGNDIYHSECDNTTPVNALQPENNQDFDQVLNRYEYHLENMISTLEDWMYFMQDLFNLNIDKLHKTTIFYVLSQFIYPLLLSPLQQLNRRNRSVSLSTVALTAEYSKNQTDADIFQSPERPKHLDRKSVRLANGIARDAEKRTNSLRLKNAALSSATNLSLVEANNLATNEVRIRCAISFHILAQMFKIITDPIFQHSLVIAIMHPLSPGQRAHFLRTPQMDLTSSFDINDDSTILEFNEARWTLLKILQEQIKDKRLSVLISVLYSTILYSRHIRLTPPSPSNEDDAYTQNSNANTTKSKIDFPTEFLVQTVCLNEWNFANNDPVKVRLHNRDVSGTTPPQSISTSSSSKKIANIIPGSSYEYSYLSSSPALSAAIGASPQVNSEVTTPRRRSDSISSGKLSASLGTSAGSFLLQNALNSTIHGGGSYGNNLLDDLNAEEVTPELMSVQLPLLIESIPQQEKSEDFNPATITPSQVADFSSMLSSQLQLSAESHDKSEFESCSQDEIESVRIDEIIVNTNDLKIVHKLLRDNLPAASSSSLPPQLQCLTLVQKALFQILGSGVNNHPLVVLQLTAHEIYYHVLQIHHLVRTLNYSDEKLQQELPGMNIDFNKHMYDVLDNIFKAGYQVAKGLHKKLNNGAQNEDIIDILLEELRRMTGCLWSNYQSRLPQLSRLLLPYTNNLSSEFFLPSSHTDVLRREIQTFILIRSLYIQTKRTMVANSDQFTIDDLGVRVLDDMLWACFLEKTYIPEEYTLGSVVKMKGKKYLDIYISPNHDLASPQHPSNMSTDSGSSTTILSALTFGYFGNGDGSNGRRHSSGGASPIPNTAVKVNKPTVEPRMMRSASNPSKTKLSISGGFSSDRPFGELLFIQDRSYLLIVKQAQHATTDKSSRGTFKIFIAAPLIHTEGHIDPFDNCTLCLKVRTWDTKLQPNMEESLYAAASPNTTQLFNGFSFAPNAIGYLQPQRKSHVFQVNITFEFNQACILAAEHIENRRQAIRQDKLKLLKKAMESWLETEK